MVGESKLEGKLSLILSSRKPGQGKPGQKIGVVYLECPAAILDSSHKKSEIPVVCGPSGPISC